MLSPGDDGGETVEDLTAFDDENLTLPADVLFNHDMNNHIRGLADLVPTLQGLLCEESQSTGEHNHCTSITTFHVTDSARQYVMQIRDKYRKAPTALVERLGEANWQRFVRIRRKKHEVDGLDQDPESEEMRLGFRSTLCLQISMTQGWECRSHLATTPRDLLHLTLHFCQVNPMPAEAASLCLLPQQKSTMANHSYARYANRS